MKQFKSFNKKTEFVTYGGYKTKPEIVMDESMEVSYQVEIERVKFYYRLGSCKMMEIFLTKDEIISMYEDIVEAEKISGKSVYKNLG